MLPTTDRHVLEALDSFNQLTTAQLASLVFPDVKSRTTYDRVLKRLYVDKYIERTEKRRLIGGRDAGGGEYVWQLGRNGWDYFGRPGRHSRKAINFHTLLASALSVRVIEMKRQGLLDIGGLVTEPDCHHEIASEYLKPDLHMTLTRASSGGIIEIFVEIDKDSQNPKRLGEKLGRYERAIAHASDPELEEFDRGRFPLVVFVCDDEERRERIVKVIKKDAKTPELFRAVTVDNFPFNIN